MIKNRRLQKARKYRDIEHDKDLCSVKGFFDNGFMAENTSLTETLHVRFYPGGGFCLWEDDGTCLCDRMSLPDEEAEKDLLLDTVVAAAPRRVIVHVGRVFLPHPMVKVLKDLFRMRLEFCSGCVVCRRQEAAPRALSEDDP